MKIRTVYLAGGINGLSDDEAVGWREEAKRLLPREVGVLDPMSRDYRGREEENVAAIVRGDLADIRASDAVIAYCPKASWGTAMEIHRVATIDRYVRVQTLSDEYVNVGLRRVIAIVPGGIPVSPWLRHHSDAVVETLEGAVDKIKGWL